MEVSGQKTGCRRPARNNPGLGPALYARWRGSAIGAVTDRIERSLILELAGDVAGRHVLDVGCGDGYLALDLWQRGARVTGVDASPDMIGAARAQAAQRGAVIAYQVAAAERLPFPAGSFDLVLAVTILCFVQDAAPVFAEIARVLRPGGRLVIGELGKWSSWAAVRRIRARHGSGLWASARFRTKGELQRLAEGAGLAVETVRGAVFYPRWAPAARLCAPCDPLLGRMTTWGAAFIAMAALKPGAAGSRADDGRLIRQNRSFNMRNGMNPGQGPPGGEF